MNFKMIAVIILTINFLYGILLEFLEKKSAHNPIPENVSDVYDDKTYRKWRAYHAEKSRIGFISQTVSYGISMILICSDAYAAFSSLFPRNDLMQMFAVILLMSFSDLLLLPVSWYDTMVIEEKYGFNRTDKKTFWTDRLKSFLISVVLMMLVGVLLMCAYQWLGDIMIPGFAVIMTSLMLVISFLYPFFSKIFNRFTPLEDGDLKNKLTGLLEKHGYRVRAIQVMDASRRSSRSNAYFTGIGKMKTIVLYDTLVRNMTTDEICAVFAHEMGHGLHRDTVRNQIFNAVRMVMTAAAAWLVLRTPGVFSAFGFSGINYGFALILTDIILSLLSPLMDQLVNAYSRKAEYRADSQAVAEGFGNDLITALKKLTRENFGDLSPDPLLVRLTYSHPTLSQRIEAIERRTRG